jgi:hypothetical protein
VRHSLRVGATPYTHRYNQEVAAKYENSEDNAIVILNELGIESLDYAGIIVFCIVSLLYDASYIKLDMRKRDIFAKGIIGLTVTSTDLSDIEKDEPGSINKIIYSLILPFYETFKHVLSKHKMYLPEFKPGETSSVNMESSVIHFISRMAGLYDKLPNYARKYNVPLNVVHRAIHEHEKYVLKTTGPRDDIDVHMITDDYSFYGRMTSGLFCGVVLHGLTANTGVIMINDDTDNINLIANLTPITSRDEHLKTLNTLLGNNLTKSTMFINYSKYCHLTCKTCQCCSICDVKNRCLICDIFHIDIRKRISMDEICKSLKLTDKHVFAVELNLYTPMTSKEYSTWVTSIMCSRD